MKTNGRLLFQHKCWGGRRAFVWRRRQQANLQHTLPAQMVIVWFIVWAGSSFSMLENGEPGTCTNRQKHDWPLTVRCLAVVVWIASQWSSHHIFLYLSLTTIMIQTMSTRLVSGWGYVCMHEPLLRRKEKRKWLMDVTSSPKHSRSHATSFSLRSCLQIDSVKYFTIWRWEPRVQVWESPSFFSFSQWAIPMCCRCTRNSNLWTTLRFVSVVHLLLFINKKRRRSWRGEEPQHPDVYYLSFTSVWML